MAKNTSGLTEEIGTTQYLVKQHRDEFVIELPSNWKITFASVNPTSAHAAVRDGYCLRVYEMPGEKLKAVFDSVISVRDMSIPLARKIKVETGSSSWVKDSSGNFKQETDVTVESSLVLETGEGNPFEA